LCGAALNAPRPRRFFFHCSRPSALNPQSSFLVDWGSVLCATHRLETTDSTRVSDSKALSLNPKPSTLNLKLADASPPAWQVKGLELCTSFKDVEHGSRADITRVEEGCVDDNFLGLLKRGGGSLSEDAGNIGVGGEVLVVEFDGVSAPCPTSVTAGAARRTVLLQDRFVTPPFSPEKGISPRHPYPLRMLSCATLGMTRMDLP
jgi:hypothetical protein